MLKRNVSIKFLSNFTDEQTPSEAKREYTLKSGLDKEISKIIVKDLKEFSKKSKPLFKMNQLELVLRKEMSCKMLYLF